MRRKRNKRKTSHQRRPVFSLILMMCLAVGGGYLGVRYVVSPWMEQQTVNVTSSDEITDVREAETSEAEEEADAIKNHQSTVIEDKVDTVATTAYAVQLGSFSSEQAAKDRVLELKEQGIEAKIQLRDNAWKVVSEGFSTREEAKAAAIRWRDIIGDAFVVEI